MRGRTAAEAVNNYLVRLQDALSLVTTSIVTASAYHDSGTTEALTLNRWQPVRLRSRSPILALRMAEWYRFVPSSEARSAERWRVAVVGYAYAIEEWESEQELLVFHRQPDQPGDLQEPHLQIGAAAGGLPLLVNAHVPTGRVLLPDVLRFAVAELGVTPRRDDWPTVFADARAALGG